MSLNMNTVEVEKIPISELADYIANKLGNRKLYIIVKGESEPIKRYQVGIYKDLNKDYRARFAQIISETCTVQGWEHLQPWCDCKARARAARFWDIGRDHDAAIIAMQGLAKEGRLFLGMTVGHRPPHLEYLWHVDDQPWEEYPESPYQTRQFGFPLGRVDQDNEWLSETLKFREGKDDSLRAVGLEGNYPVFVTSLL